ncbi:MAG: hypothetical protein WB609_07975 [Candidatus Cybelea sp.]
MVYLTLSIEGESGDARRVAVDDAVARQGGTALWRANEGARRWYALLELPQRHDRNAIASVSGGTLHDRAIIALAVVPAVPEALPLILGALAGPGRPAGILDAYPCEGGVVVEWDPAATSPPVVLGIIDLELKRFGSGRTAELLAPLPASVASAIAANGLQAPEIDPARILELRIENA